MGTAVKSTVTPLFLASETGPIFAVYYAPAGRERERSGLIFVPPFAEEMNRARRTVALQARILAGLGVGVLVVDLFGTGDSAGDFSNARCQIWLNNVFDAADWLNRRGISALGLWGLRAGALLATAAAAHQSGRFHRLVLWQPGANGKTLLSQFLRIRVTAARLGGDVGESTEKLRAELAAGRSMEIAGYELSPELAETLSGLQMEQFNPGPDARVYWFEVAAKAGDQLQPVSERVVGTWRSTGIAVASEAVSGEQFWAVEEATPAMELLGATARAIEACPK